MEFMNGRQLFPNLAPTRFYSAFPHESFDGLIHLPKLLLSLQGWATRRLLVQITLETIDLPMNNASRKVSLSILPALLGLLLATVPESAFCTVLPAQDQNPIIGRNIRVEDQQGHRLNFFQDLIKGKTVAINFIFTRCTSSCPLSTAVFSKVQQKTRAQPVQLISISLDPAEDTPEKLRTYAESFKAEPNWHFITGEQTSIKALLKAFGIYSVDKNFHTNMVLVGNEVTRRWLRLYSLPNADDIVTALDHVR
jgi:protein SCO1